MLFPKKVKHRKWHRHAGSVRANATRTHRINFGEWGLKAMTHGYATSRQIESARRTISRYLHKGGKMWIRVFPDKPITIKGSEVPMGSGKGTVDHYVANVRPGMILFEIDGVGEEISLKALKNAGYKMSMKTKIVKRIDT